MDELILHCRIMLKLMDEKYPDNKGWAVNNLYQTVSEILEKAENNIVETKDIHWFSLGRCYADEAEYTSPILSEFDIVKKILEELKSKP